MVGISGFGAEQFHVAKQQPPHLKAIFPFDPRGAYGVLGSFREEYPGGVLHLFRYLVGHFSAMHQHRGAPGTLPEPRETYWRDAMANPDYRMYPNILNLLAQKGQHMPPIFDLLIDPYDHADRLAKAEADLARIKVPFYTGTGWYGYTYKTHLNGAQNYFAAADAPKKLMLTGPAHLERPFRSFHHEILKWYDHWLKGIDTGVMREKPVKFWVMGENKWREASDWPLPETRWTRLYLRNWERLSAEPFVPASVDHFTPPDAFVQMPPTRPRPCRSCATSASRYRRPDGRRPDRAHPLRRDRPGRHQLVRGAQGRRPGPVGDEVREGERELPDDLPEREVTRGWLKASNRALDPARSKPWKPWHKLTREAREKVMPGEIDGVLHRDHGDGQPVPQRAPHRPGDHERRPAHGRRGRHQCGVRAVSHLQQSSTVLHKIYHDANRPSHLLLPIVPE